MNIQNFTHFLFHTGSTGSRWCSRSSRSEGQVTNIVPGYSVDACMSLLPSSPQHSSKFFFLPSQGEPRGAWCWRSGNLQTVLMCFQLFLVCLDKQLAMCNVMSCSFNPKGPPGAQGSTGLPGPAGPPGAVVGLLRR